MQLKRYAIKYVRDKAKARYNKGTQCRICGQTQQLDFHHYYTLSPLFNDWLKKQKITIKSQSDVLQIRQRFIAQHQPQLYQHAVTLCHNHHMQLHGIYGKDPNLGTAKKQMRWVQRQRQKNGL